MYFCEKRELNCLKRLILQRIIYIILMDSNNLTPLRKGVVGVQFLFVAFGATVLVPLLVGLDPSTALFTAGIGTLIFHAVTRGKVPVFLGSSFAFIAPIIKATELYGLPGTLSGMVGVALVYFVMSDRFVTGGNRSEYGKRELGTGTAFVGYRSRCFNESQRAFETDSYLLWNCSRVSGCMAFLRFGFVRCQGCCLDWIAAVCLS